MSLSKDILGEELPDLKIENIEEFFKTAREETQNLEFKGGETKPTDLLKEICAFLNTDGGLLIYGAPRGKNFTGSEPLHPTDLIKTEETISQLVSSNISPVPVGIKSKTIPYQDKFVHVIEIPKSPFAPHQIANAGAYYLRIGTISAPAPHGVVEALFNRRQKPMLSCLLFPRAYSGNSTEIMISLQNDTIVTARETGFNISVYAHSAARARLRKLGDAEDTGLRIPNFKENVVDKLILQNSSLINSILVQGHIHQEHFIITSHSTRFLFVVSYFCADSIFKRDCIFINPLNPSETEIFNFTGNNQSDFDEFMSSKIKNIATNAGSDLTNRSKLDFP